MRWVLPDHIQDVLPPEAERLESLRRDVLDMFRLRGYQLVIPPMLEYLDSLTTGAGRDLQLRTFKLVDQLSGRSMGVRADMTPQVARIDAHLLNRKGVSRLCYCGSVLHTLPATLMANREPIQLGAEIYGHAGIEADIEILRLLAEVLKLTCVSEPRIDISHVGLFHALVSLAGLDASDAEKLFGRLQIKDVPALEKMLEGVSRPVCEALLALPNLYGGAEVIDAAEHCLPSTPEIAASLADLRVLAEALPALPISFDLADLRGYHYHSGAVFAAYGGNRPSALALGGRYDHVGAAFGRARPAAGFSLDLRELVRYRPQTEGRGSILAPMSDDEPLTEAVTALRMRGEVVVAALPGHEADWKEAGCDRRLARQDDGSWRVEPLNVE